MGLISFDFLKRTGSSGASSDLVPTLMDIFDAMIGGTRMSSEQLQGPVTAATMAAVKTTDGTCPTPPPPVVQTPRHHFPVLKIVEPGDPETSSVTTPTNSKIGETRSSFSPDPFLFSIFLQKRGRAGGFHSTTSSLHFFSFYYIMKISEGQSVLRLLLFHHSTFYLCVCFFSFKTLLLFQSDIAVTS